MNVKFYLLRSKSKTPTGLICSESFAKKRIRFCVGESINPKFWNAKTSRARMTPSFPESQEFNHRLNNMASKINKLYLRSFDANEESPTKAMIEKSIRTEVLNKKSKVSFFEFYQQFIDKTAAGGRLNVNSDHVDPPFR